MKVDMSPKAVKERLQTMDELWLLSVKLMNSKKAASAANNKNKPSENVRNAVLAAEKANLIKSGR